MPSQRSRRVAEPDGEAVEEVEREAAGTAQGHDALPEVAQDATETPCYIEVAADDENHHDERRDADDRHDKSGGGEALEELVNVHPRAGEECAEHFALGKEGYDRHAEHKERVDDTLRDHCAEAAP